ncbi:uncharacterized protein V1510DRAFT_347191, partial [Dipodascopsis tothii]|uniref:uncharacterized protein n=1 Tax=Dipodascopsis tothii TaxID=44089 RepID=UPI0034CFF137
MGSIRRSKTKRRTRDLDQVSKDIATRDSRALLRNQPVDEDKPGLGQHYCVDCAKYFETAAADKVHRRGKNHKRRVRMLREQPYSQAEADAAAGVGVVSYMAFVEENRVARERTAAE